MGKKSTSKGDNLVTSTKRERKGGGASDSDSEEKKANLRSRERLCRIEENTGPLVAKKPQDRSYHEKSDLQMLAKGDGCGLPWQRGGTDQKEKKRKLAGGSAVLPKGVPMGACLSPEQKRRKKKTVCPPGI